MISKLHKSGGNPHCRSCNSFENENIFHIVSKCIGYEELRRKIKTEYEEVCHKSQTNLNFKEIVVSDISFCQFVLDPTSMNLSTRINIKDPILKEIFQISRDFCYALHVRRMKILQ